MKKYIFCGDKCVQKYNSDHSRNKNGKKNLACICIVIQIIFSHGGKQDKKAVALLLDIFVSVLKFYHFPPMLQLCRLMQLMATDAQLCIMQPNEMLAVWNCCCSMEPM